MNVAEIQEIVVRALAEHVGDGDVPRAATVAAEIRAPAMTTQKGTVVWARRGGARASARLTPR